MNIITRSRAAVQAFRGKAINFSEGAGWSKLYGTGLTRAGRIAHDDFERQVGEFKSHIAACTDIIASKAAVVPLRLYVDDAGSPTGRTEIMDHPLLDMWYSVNSYTNHFEFVELLITYLCLTGNAYIYLVDNVLGIPAEMHLLPSQNVKVIPDAQKIVGGYRYRRGGVYHDFSPEEVLHLKLPNPFDPFFYGLSLVCKAVIAIGDQNNIDVMQDAYFRNLAAPANAVLLREGARISPEIFDRIKAQFNDEYVGAEKTGKTLILAAVQDIKSLEGQINLRDFSFLKGRANIKEEIYSIWRVPLTYGSRDSTPSRATLENDRVRLGEDCLEPHLTRMGEKFNEGLCTRYDEALYCEFDISVVIPPDREGRQKEIESHIRSGYSTPDEERAKDGLPPRPDGGGAAGVAINPFGALDLGAEAEVIETAVKSALSAEVKSGLGLNQAVTPAAAQGKAKKIGPTSAAQVEKKVSPQRAGMRRKVKRDLSALADRAAELVGEIS